MTGWNQALLKRLGKAAFRIGTGVGAMAALAASAAAAELADVPEETVGTLIDSPEVSSMERRDRARLLGVLGLDVRANVRHDVALALGRLPVDFEGDSDATWRRLARDSSPRVRSATGWSLGASLCSTAPLDRTRLIGEWATDPDPLIRLALARALHAPFDAIGARTAVTMLRDDADPAVRHAALRAGQVRLGRDAVVDRS